MNGRDQVAKNSLITSTHPMKASAGTRGYWEDQNQRIDSFTIITVRANAFLFMSECR